MPAKYKFDYSCRYWDDLLKIAEWQIEQTSAIVAEHFRQDLAAQIALLKDMPRLFPTYELVPEYRKMVLNDWNYVIFYRVIEEKKLIIVHRIYHTAQNYQTEVAKEGQF